jgi:hypothetical protein
MAIRRHPYPSKFIVNFEDAGAEKYFSKKFDYEDLLIAYGDHITDYTDLTQFAKNLYSAYSVTLSDSHTLSPLYEVLVGSGGVKDISDNFVRWKIFSKPDRRAISLGNPNASEDCYGAGGFLFKIRLDVDWYGPNDVLAPLRNKRCQVVIQSQPKPQGGAYDYEVVMLSDPNNASVFPVEYLKDSDYWIKMGSLGSDLGSNEWGSLQVGFDYAYIEFEANMTTMQWKFFVDKKAHQEYGSVEVARCYDDGRPMPGSGKITNFIEVEGMTQIEMEKELFMAYGSQTDHLISASTKNRITTGAGLFEFLEESNVIPYNPSANGIDRMVSEIDALWFDRIPVGQRRLLLYTGHAGLKLFHEWIEEKYGNTAVVTPYDFILGDAEPFDKSRDGYAYGKNQFTKYYVQPFGEIIVAHWAFLDNTRINTVTYPNSHYPVSSFEFIALDIGFGEPNVQMLKNSEEENTWVIPGLWSPFGATGPNNPVYKQPTNPDEWGYHWAHRSSFGIVVFDTSRMLWFKPNVVG